MKCLEIEASKRYASAAQVAFDLQHPSQVLLTERAERGKRDGFLKVAGRWLGSMGHEPAQAGSVAHNLGSVPIVMVAVDLAPGHEELAELLAQSLRLVLDSEKGARLTCVTVRKTPLVGLDINIDESGANLHVRMLAELMHWARPLRIAPERVTYHVLEAHDPAVALVEYASSNHVDHIVIGARGSSTLRRFLGSVSSQVVAEAPCTVTVVRVPRHPHGSV